MPRTLEAGWVRENGLIRLVRTPEMEKATLERERKTRATLLDKWKKESAAEAAKVPAFTELQAQMIVSQAVELTKSGDIENYDLLEKLVRRTPAGRFAERVVRALPTDELSLVGSEERMVFRARPTRRQRKLTLPTEVLSTYLAEQSIYTKVPKPPIVTAFENHLKIREVGQVADVMAVVQNSESHYAITVWLIGSDRKEITRLHAQIPTWMEVVPASGKPNRPVEYSSLSTEYRDLWRKMRTNEPANPSPAMMAFAKDPVAHDPLSLGLTESVRALSEAENRPVVLRAWDILGIQTLGVSRRTGSGVEGFRTTLTRERAQIMEMDGWIVIRSPMPVTHQRRQFDRSALKNWLEISAAKRLADFVDTAFLTHRSPGELYLLPVYWLGLASPVAHHDQLGRFGGSWIRAYGALSPAERHALAQGKSLQWNRLTPDVQRHLRSVLYGLETKVSANGTSTPETIDLEPTTLFPLDVPSGAMLSATVSKAPILLGLQKVPNPFGRGTARRGIASLGYQVARGPDELMQQFRAVQDRFKIVTYVEVSMKMTWAEGLTSEQVLPGYEAPSAEIYELSNLPEPWKSKVAEAAEYYRSHPEANAPHPTSDKLPE